MGKKGAELITKKISIKQDSFKINAIDPSGAGDAFCSGFITTFLQNGFKDVNDIDVEKGKEMLVYAQAAGACSASAVGCSVGVSKENVEKLMEEQGNAIKEKTIIQ